MARHQPLWANYSQYLTLRLMAAGLHMFPVDRNLATARAAGTLAYHLDRRHRVRALHNLNRSFPKLDPPQREQIARRSMEHFLQLGVEVMFTTRLIHLDTFADHLHLQRMEQALELLISDQPTILLTGHFGNWELMGYLLATIGLDLHAVARPIDNPLINRWLLGVRERRGMHIITKWGASERMQRIIRSGGTLAFIADQNAGDRGMFVPFFGRLASSYKSIGLLAMRYNVPIICGYARRIGDRFEYELGTTDVILPEQWKSRDDALFYLTARYTRAIERMVHLAPEQYLWIHRRWKSRPRFERQGKPMPEAMHTRLHALPWMDERMMDRIQKPH